jgi:hypothetical protein
VYLLIEKKDIFSCDELLSFKIARNHKSVNFGAVKYGPALVTRPARVFYCLSVNCEISILQR